MKRFGIFRQYEDGSRVFIGVNEDDSSAKTQAIRLKEQTGWEHLVFNLRTKIKTFDTELYDRRLRKWNTMKARQPQQPRLPERKPRRATE